MVLLDGLRDAGINAVFLQVRSECDAMYDSPLEPWSFWLTGQQGAAPDPWYDPLAFAVREAHRRGMELHAWFNPYRAQESSLYTPSADHVTRTHPEWILHFGDLRILDPGRAAARDYAARVITDVARRYDVDGIHFDDYFYPYPPNHISDEDEATFAEESRGFASISEWRRDNVNLLIAQVADSLRAIKPALKFGVSPIGIWKNGVPAGIVGLDTYNVIFADPTAWLAAGTVDYLVPQLYWAFGGPQDYASLASWWVEQGRGRHLYPGHALFKADSQTNPGELFSPEEVPGQVRFNRDSPGLQGSVFFRARNITHLHSQGFAEVLRTDLYRHPALAPPMDWKATEPPAAPRGLELALTDEGEAELSWEPVEGARRYAVYRVRSPGMPDPGEAALDARNLLAVTGETALMDALEGSEPHHYFVQAVGDNSSESRPSALVSSTGPATDIAMDAGAATRRLAVYPNPFQRLHADRIFRDGDGSRGAAGLQLSRPEGADPDRRRMAQPGRVRLRVGRRGRRRPEGGQRRLLPRVRTRKPPPHEAPGPGAVGASGHPAPSRPSILKALPPLPFATVRAPGWPRRCRGSGAGPPRKRLPHPPGGPT